VICFEEKFPVISEGTMEVRHELVLNEAIFVVPCFGPGVRAEVMESGDGARGQEPFEEV
jgi:hypothetical protein